MRRIGGNAPCPCGSGRKLKGCCGRWHAGAPAPTAEALMRSRYAAYAIGDVGYVRRTWAGRPPDEAAWRADVRAWCEAVEFVGLRVIEAAEDGDAARVVFHAELRSGGRDVSFGEASRFVRVDGRWLYVDGEPVVPRSVR